MAPDGHRRCSCPHWASNLCYRFHHVWNTVLEQSSYLHTRHCWMLSKSPHPETFRHPWCRFHLWESVKVPQTGTTVEKGGIQKWWKTFWTSAGHSMCPYVGIDSNWKVCRSSWWHPICALFKHRGSSKYRGCSPKHMLAIVSASILVLCAHYVVDIITLLALVVFNAPGRIF